MKRLPWPDLPSLASLLCTLPRNRTISTNCDRDRTINTPALLSQFLFHRTIFIFSPSFAHCAQPVQVGPPQLAPIVTKIVPAPPPSTRNIHFHSFKLKPVKFYANFTAVIISASTLKLVFLQETILCSFTPKKMYLLSFLNGN